MSFCIGEMDLDLTWEEEKKRTMEAIRNPQPGDYFHEMYTYKAWIVQRTGNLVITMELVGGDSAPHDCELWVGTVDQFIDRMTYKTDKNNAWVTYESKKQEISGWLERWNGEWSDAMSLQRTCMKGY